jgi:hypothetical protein
VITIIKQAHQIVLVFTGPGSPEDRVTALRLINKHLPVFAAGMHTADSDTLAYEARRLEALTWTSPTVRRMQQIVADEQREREVSRG